MHVLELLDAKRNLALQVLRDFNQNYLRLDDTTRLEKSNTIFDEVNSYLQIKENLILPYIKKSGEYDDIVKSAHDLHSLINEISEKAIMMHVDEPSGEYFHDMVLLQGLLEKAQQHDHESLFPWANTYLSPEDQLEISKRIKNQMVHESLPSSGMTVY